MIKLPLGASVPSEPRENVLTSHQFWSVFGEEGESAARGVWRHFRPRGPKMTLATPSKGQPFTNSQ